MGGSAPSTQTAQVPNWSPQQEGIFSNMLMHLQGNMAGPPTYWPQRAAPVTDAQTTALGNIRGLLNSITNPNSPVNQAKKALSGVFNQGQGTINRDWTKYVASGAANDYNSLIAPLISKQYAGVRPNTTALRGARNYSTSQYGQQTEAQRQGFIKSQTARQNQQKAQGLGLVPTLQSTPIRNALSLLNTSIMGQQGQNIAAQKGMEDWMFKQQWTQQNIKDALALLSMKPYDYVSQTSGGSSGYGGLIAPILGGVLSAVTLGAGAPLGAALIAGGLGSAAGGALGRM